MTITRSGNILLEAFNPHDENVFGVLIDTFGTLNLNISGRYYRRTQCTDDTDQNARMHILIFNFACSAFLLSHVCHALALLK